MRQLLSQLGCIGSGVEPLLHLPVGENKRRGTAATIVPNAAPAQPTLGCQCPERGTEWKWGRQGNSQQGKRAAEAACEGSEPEDGLMRCAREWPSASGCDARRCDEGIGARRAAGLPL